MMIWLKNLRKVRYRTFQLRSYDFGRLGLAGRATSASLRAVELGREEGGVDVLKGSFDRVRSVGKTASRATMLDE